MKAIHTRRTLTVLVCGMLLAAFVPVRASGMTVETIAVCQDVVQREPVGAGDVFPREIGKLYCFTRIQSASGNTEITHNWYYQGMLKASVVLPVKGHRWRTWSAKTIRADWTGEWMVEVLDARGQALESVVFVVR